MASLQAPPSINDARTQALLTLIARLDALDLVPLLVYRIDSVPDSALPFLAWQFDIADPRWQLDAALGAGGGPIDWDSIVDIDALSNIDVLGGGASGAIRSSGDRFEILRQMIEIAVPLHRVRGTPAAVKQALAALGWSNVTLLEGQNSWGGTSWPNYGAGGPGDQGWAVFRVMIPIAAGQAIPVGAVATILAAINFFKNERSWLDSVWFVFPGLVGELLPAPSDLSGVFDYLLPVPRDLFTVNFPAQSDNYSFVPMHNALYQKAGIIYANQPVGPTDGATTLNGNPVEGNP